MNAYSDTLRRHLIMERLREGTEPRCWTADARLIPATAIESRLAEVEAFLPDASLEDFQELASIEKARSIKRLRKYLDVARWLEAQKEIDHD